MRRPFLKSVSLWALLLILFGFVITVAGQDLIPPTRTLEGQEESRGKLTVASEPPNLEVFVDGSRIGETPVWRREVEAGPHKVRVRHAESEVFVEPGKTLVLSFFKDSFIQLPQEPEAAERREPEPDMPTAARKPAKPREEEQPRDLTLWERFINRTSHHF